MTIAFVQDEVNSDSGVTQISQAFGASCSVNNLIVGFVSCQDTTNIVTATATVGGIPMVPEARVNHAGLAGGWTLWMFSLSPLEIAGAHTVTFTFNGTVSFVRLHTSEWSGAARYGARDKVATATGTGTVPSSGNMSPDTDNQLVISSALSESASISAGAGFTEMANFDDFDSSEYLVQTVKQTVAAEFAAGNDDWIVVAATFRAIGDAPAQRPTFIHRSFEDRAYFEPRLNSPGLFYNRLAYRPAHIFPRVIASSQYDSSADATSHDLTVGTPLRVGSLYVVKVLTSGAPTITWPSGWTAITGLPTSFNGITLDARYRVTDGTETSPLTLSLSSSQALLAHWEEISQHDSSTNPPELGTSATGTDRNPDPPNVNPSAAGRDNFLWIAFCGVEPGITSMQQPAGYPALSAAVINAGGTLLELYAAYRNYFAEQHNPPPFGGGGVAADWIAQTIIVYPGTEGAEHELSAQGAAEGAYSITGAAAELVPPSITLNAESGAYSITGAAAAVLVGYMLNAATGVYSVTGADASLLRGLAINAAAGSYTISGLAAQLEAGHVLVAEVGSYSISGAAASLEKGYLIIGESGAYVLSGVDAQLFHDFMLNAGVGAYAITGADADLSEQAGIEFNAETGSYTITGANAALLHDMLLSAESGAYSVTGAAAALERGLMLDAQPGVYSLTGAELQMLKGFALQAEQGIYTMLGFNAEFEVSSAPPDDSGGEYIIILRRRRLR